ncbi:glycosyl hydrolases family 18-domain-containing protein [Apiospora sp. TS-2023a]
MEVLHTQTCSGSVCEGPDSGCVQDDDEDDDDNGVVDSTWANKRSYVSGSGKTLWSYYGDESPSATNLHESGIEDRRAGGSRGRLLDLKVLTDSIVYAGKFLSVVSRIHPSGLGAFRGDGKDTFIVNGAIDFLSTSCGSTAMRHIPFGSIYPAIWNFEHLREVNFLYGFVESLFTGRKFSGAPMANTFDPMDIYRGWNQVYDVSLPRIGSIVTDVRNWQEPMTPNDRIMECIGSLAYREGAALLPRDLNRLKATIMQGQRPLGGPEEFKELLDDIAGGSESDLVKVLKNLKGLTALFEKVIGVFNYLNLPQVQVAFHASGNMLDREMEFAETYIPGFMGLAAAWNEYELDYYAEVTRRARVWFTDRIGLIGARFPMGGSLTNPSVIKLVYETAILAEQLKLIKSPLGIFRGLADRNSCPANSTAPQFGVCPSGYM